MAVTNRINICNCNALPVPHVHDASGIRHATDMEKKMGAAPDVAASRFATPVAKG